jgi:hypothetical protein
VPKQQPSQPELSSVEEAFLPFRTGLHDALKRLTPDQVASALFALIDAGAPSTLYDVRDVFRAFDIEVRDF